MRNSTLKSALVGAFTINLVSAPCQSAETNASQAVYRSNCGPGNSHLGHYVNQLRPWLSQFERKLKEHPDYNKLTAEFLGNSGAGEPVTCAFAITENGDVLNPMIRASTGSSNVNNKLLTLIESSGSLSRPPNKLPLYRGLQVSLFNYQHRVVLLAIDLDTRGNDEFFKNLQPNAIIWQ